MSTLRSRIVDGLIVVSLYVSMWTVVAFLIAMVMTMAFDSLIPNTTLIGTVVSEDWSGHYVTIDCGNEKLVYGGIICSPEVRVGDVAKIVVHRGMSWKKGGTEHVVSVERMDRQSNYNILADAEGRDLL